MSALDTYSDLHNVSVVENSMNYESEASPYGMESEASPYIIVSYYWLTLLFSTVTIALGAMSMEAHEKCASKLTGSDKTALNAYQIVGIFALIVASILFLLTAVALWYKMGIVKVAVKKPFERKTDDELGLDIKTNRLNNTVEDRQRNLDAARVQAMLDKPHHRSLFV